MNVVEFLKQVEEDDRVRRLRRSGMPDALPNAIRLERALSTPRGGLDTFLPDDERVLVSS